MPCIHQPEKAACLIRECEGCRETGSCFQATYHVLKLKLTVKLFTMIFKDPVRIFKEKTVTFKDP